jgi:Tfp pilus assembly protein PilZ
MMPDGRTQIVHMDEVLAQIERRATPRHFLRFSVRFRSCSELAEAIEATTRNIGLGGLCLKTQKTYQEGMRLELTIKLGDADGPELKVFATVAWVAPGRAIGARFDVLQPGALNALRQALEAKKRRDDQRSSTGTSAASAPQRPDPTPGRFSW